MASFLELLRDKSTRRERRRRAAAFLSVLGERLDALALRFEHARRASFLEDAPDDALDHIAESSSLLRVRLDTAATFRAYLRRRWRIWEEAARRERLLDEINRLGYPNALVVTWADLAEAGNPGAFGGIFTTFFYVVIKPPHRFGPAKLWDGGLQWDDGSLWDIQGDPQDLEDIKRAIRKWKPASSSCRYIEIWLRVGLFGLPTELVRVPMWEPWEYDRDGQASDLYNSGY